MLGLEETGAANGMVDEVGEVIREGVIGVGDSKGSM